MIVTMQKIALATSICLMFHVAPLYAQSTDAQEHYANLVRKEFGQDHELINGVQYYNRHNRAQGDPYFLVPVYQTGSLILEGREYPDVSLRYDIHSQHVELQYRSFSGGANQLVTVTDHVDAFTLGSYHFRKMTLEQDREEFFQVISAGCISCYIHWKKELLPFNGSFTYIEQFSEAKRSMWLDLNGELYPFSSRKDFAGCFSDVQRKDIKRLFARSNFRFRTATVDEIIRQLDAVCQLLEEKGY
jgi:hypothetical protein